MSSSVLKIIAIISMLIDHIGAYLVDGNRYEGLYVLMRTIGRIAFPIFCFLIVQGFLHTHDVRKYIMRMLVFAVISEVPYNLAVHLTPFVPGHQNVFWALLLGLAAISAIDRFSANIILQMMFVVLAGIPTVFIFPDNYYLFGFLMILSLYYLKDYRSLRIAAVIGLNVIMGQEAGALALLFIEFYNGKKGINIKYAAYAFYPVHLTIIWLLRIFS